MRLYMEMGFRSENILSLEAKLEEKLYNLKEGLNGLNRITHTSQNQGRKIVTHLGRPWENVMCST